MRPGDGHHRPENCKGRKREKSPRACILVVYNWNSTTARIRKIEIENFRGIKSLAWLPSPGINCRIGPGDSGKSSILDAIDYCIGARRNIPFTDADFNNSMSNRRSVFR